MIGFTALAVLDGKKNKAKNMTTKYLAFLAIY
jgi:hypothetical protein